MQLLNKLRSLSGPSPGLQTYSKCDGTVSQHGRKDWSYCRLPQTAAAALPSSFCHQDGQILTDRHKGGKAGAGHHLMVQSMKVRKAWQPECETAGHVTSAVGKPRDMMVVLSSHAPARSVTGTLPWDGATHTQGALSSANPIQKPRSRYTLEIVSRVHNQCSPLHSGGPVQQTLLLGADETGGFKQQNHNSRTLWVN